MPVRRRSAVARAWPDGVGPGDRGWLTFDVRTFYRACDLGARGSRRSNDTGGCDRMRQAAEAIPRAHARVEEPLHDSHGRAGARNGSHVLGRPRPRRGPAPGHRRQARMRPSQPAAGPAWLAIADTISLYARKYAGAGAVYEYLTDGAHHGRRGHGRQLLRRCSLPRGRRTTSGSACRADNLWKTHNSDSGPTWRTWGMTAPRARPRPQLLRRAPRASGAMLNVAGALVDPDADPCRRDHRQGGKVWEYC